MFEDETLECEGAVKVGDGGCFGGGRFDGDARRRFRVGGERGLGLLGMRPRRVCVGAGSAEGGGGRW